MYDPAVDLPTLFAASKAIDKAIGKATLEVGSHHVDQSISLRLFGVIEKGDEQTIQCKPKLPVPALLALICKRAKLNRADARQLIADAAADVLAGELPKTGFDDRLRDAQEAIDAEIAAAPKALDSRAGATKWLGTATIEKAS